MKINW